MLYDTDSEKLRLLADWFDVKFPNDDKPEVQDFLRELADKLEHNDIEAQANNEQFAEYNRLTGIDQCQHTK